MVSHSMSPSPFRAAQLDGACETDGAGGCLFEGEIGADRLCQPYSAGPTSRPRVLSKDYERGEVRRFPRGGAHKHSR